MADKKILGRCLWDLTISDREVEEGSDVLNRSRSEIFQVEDAEMSGPNALLFLQLLIALVTMSAVKASAISMGFLLVSLVTNRISLEE